MLDLTSVNAKISRGINHAQAVESEIRAWMNGSPYRLVHEFNSDSTEHSLVFRVISKPELERWALMVGDAIHNLRCCLDHLVYAIAVHESGKNPPLNWDSLQFPIYDEPDRFIANSPRLIG